MKHLCDAVRGQQPQSHGLVVAASCQKQRSRVKRDRANNVDVPRQSVLSAGGVCLDWGEGGEGVGGVLDTAGLRQRGSRGGVAEELLFLKNILLVEPADHSH
jgi:hypothetical protein